MPLLATCPLAVRAIFKFWPLQSQCSLLVFRNDLELKTDKNHMNKKRKTLETQIIVKSCHPELSAGFKLFVIFTLGT